MTNIYEVTDTDPETDFGRNESWARPDPIEWPGHSPEDAAEAYIKGFYDSDPTGFFEKLKPDHIMPVWMRKKGGNALERYDVAIEFEPNFTAKEAKESG